jgi:fatty acid-binding protein DegV
MKKVAVIADSIGCIPGELIKTHGIEIVAPNIFWNGSIFRDWLDITPGQAYELAKGVAVPARSATILELQ